MAELHPLLQVSTDEVVVLGSGLCPDDLLARLQSGQRLRRLLTLRAIRLQVEEADEHSAVRGLADEAFAAIGLMEHQAPEVIERLIAQPLLGAWCEQALRLLSVRASTPALVDHFGRLAPMMLAATAPSAISIEMSVRPDSDGQVSFTGLGVLELGEGGSGPFSCVAGHGGLTIRSASVECRVVLSEDGTSSELRQEAAGMVWRPLWRLSADHLGHSIEVDLEDRDPLRLLGYDPQSFAELGSEDWNRWSTCFRGAWSLLVEHHIGCVGPLEAALRTIVPRASERPSLSISSTSADTFGLIGMTEPTDGVAMAVTLVHEFQHAKLSALLDLQPLTSPAGRRYYAPWRDDPRPVDGFLQGIFAFVGITQFWARQIGRTPEDERALAAFEFARNREQVRLALDQIEAGEELTGDGKRILEGMREGLVEMDLTAVDLALVSLARDVCADHQTRWRIRHLTPTGDVQTSSEPPPSNDDGTLLRLCYLSMREPDRFVAIDQGQARLPDLEPRPADLAFVAGRIDEALALNSEQLAVRPGDLNARIGLGLCLRRLGRSDAAAALLDHPERWSGTTASAVDGEAGRLLDHVMTTP